MEIKAVAIGDKWGTPYEQIKSRCVIPQGWNDSLDVSFLTDPNENLNTFLPLIEPYKKESSKVNAFTQLLQGIKTGNILLAFDGNDIKGICEVPNDFIYVYQSEYDFANAIFPIKWIDWDTDFALNSGISGFADGSHGVRGINNIYKGEIVNFIANNWETYKANNNIDIQLSEKSDKLEILKQLLPNKIEQSRNYYYNLLKEKDMQEKLLPFITLLKANKNIILTGAPGTGKTYLAKDIAKAITGSDADKNNSQYGFVQFHPSYDYTDFVEGLRPDKKEGQKELGFVLRDGTFMEFCKNAKTAFREDENKQEDEKRKFVFVIDEINRGEISKIFGELFFTIDPGYRGEKGKVKTQYSNLREVTEQYFHVPENVYVIGTMNDIDRSVECMDFAMRRRFAWMEITAKESQRIIDSPDFIEKLNGKINIQILKNRMNNLNNAIIDEKLGLSKAYQIGAAYFKKLELYMNEDNPFKCLWDYHLEILLSEYLRGTPKAGDNLISLEVAYSNEN